MSRPVGRRVSPRVGVVSTPVGDARVTQFPVAAPGPRARLVLGHGAGRGADTADLLVLADRLPGDGVEVVLVDQPWVLAGRRVAAAPAVLDLAWCAVVRTLPPDGRPVVWGGRSAGARVAARAAVRGAAAAPAADVPRPGALLLLAFPLHPPGRPGASRAEELEAALRGGVPAVVVQGQRDSFGGPEELKTAVPGLRVVAAPGCGHDLVPARSGPVTTGEVGDLLVAAALEAVALARLAPAPVR